MRSVVGKIRRICTDRTRALSECRYHELACSQFERLNLLIVAGLALQAATVAVVKRGRQNIVIHHCCSLPDARQGNRLGQKPEPWQLPPQDNESIHTDK